jgi:SAM-dependent methyltransferase
VNKGRDSSNPLKPAALLSRWMLRLSSLMFRVSARLSRQDTTDLYLAELRLNMQKRISDVSTQAFLKAIEPIKVDSENRDRLLAILTILTRNNVQTMNKIIAESAAFPDEEIAQAFLMTLYGTGDLVRLINDAAANQSPPDDFLPPLIAIYRTLTTALHDLVKSGNGVASGEDVSGEISNLLGPLSATLPPDKGIAAAKQMLLEHIEPGDRHLVPVLEKSEKPVTNTWTYQNEVLQWDFKPDDLVLDIGSGGWPFSKATHLADMFTDETTHRHEELRKDDRPFLCLDIQKMPFADNTWDFTFCSHVLEHLDAPGEAIRELARVSKRGYIEVPTRLSDVMLNFTRIKDHHRWHGIVLDGTLVLMEWRDDERRDMGSSAFFHALQSGYENEFRSFFERNWDIFYAMLHWEGEIPFLIIDKHGRVIDRHDKGGAA